MLQQRHNVCTIDCIRVHGHGHDHSYDHGHDRRGQGTRWGSNLKTQQDGTLDSVGSRTMRALGGNKRTLRQKAANMVRIAVTPEVPDGENRQPPSHARTRPRTLENDRVRSRELDS